MRHPPTVWVDQAYAEEPLDRLRRDYVDYLRGRAQPTLPNTVVKYNSALLAFIRFLDRQDEEQVLGSVTPGAVNAWVNDQRSISRSEDGIAGRRADRIRCRRGSLITINPVSRRSGAVQYDEGSGRNV